MNLQTLPNIISGVSFLALTALPVEADGQSINLGSAQNFAVLGATTVTNTGLSSIQGDLGLSPGTSITGFPPGVIVGTQHLNDAVAAQARTDAFSAYSELKLADVTQTLTGSDLGGMTLIPGVYSFSSSAGLSGTLTLDAQNEPEALFIFQIGEALTTANNSAVVGINGTSASQVFFQVGSSATLGSNSNFFGTIIADTSNTLTTGATVEGRVISLTGAVTLDSNIISIPEPSALFLCLSGTFLCFSHRGRLLSR